MIAYGELVLGRVLSRLREIQLIMGSMKAAVLPLPVSAHHVNVCKINTVIVRKINCFNGCILEVIIGLI
jgi:hypothetical protein